MSLFRRRLVVSGLLASAALAATPALAQDAPPAPDNQANNQPDNGDIVITALKRSETLQNVPISVQALSTKKLDELNISNFQDYVASLPSVHMADTYGRAHHGRAATVAAITEWAQQHDVPLVDLKAAVAEQVMSGRGNPDGIHWNFEAHQGVAELMLKALAEAGVATEKPRDQAGAPTEKPRG